MAPLKLSYHAGGTILRPIRLSQSASSEPGNTSTKLYEYIPGFIAAGLAFLGLVVWLVVRIYRKGSKKHRENDRGTAFLNVRGVVKDDCKEKEKSDE